MLNKNLVAISFSVTCKERSPVALSSSVSFMFLCFQIYVPTNPHGAELLPPGIIVAETDFYLRRLWGEPSEVSSTILLMYQV